MKKYLFGLFSLCLMALPARAQQPLQEIVIVFDFSYSMNEMLGAQTRLNAAKQALATAAGQIAPAARVGLRVFGTTPVQGNVRDSCFDSQLIMPIAPFNKDALIHRVMGLQAYGQTPLGYSLELAGRDFSPSPGVNKVIILISDGEESCGKDPVAVIQNLKAEGIDVKVHAIGFAVDPGAQAQLQQIAGMTGGTYQDARDAAQLKEALQEVAEEENILAGGSREHEKPAPLMPQKDLPRKEEQREMLLRAERGRGENILAATAGARIEEASNEDLAFLIDGAEDLVSFWEGDYAVFSFKDRQPVLLEKFAVPVYEQSEQNPGVILLSGSLDGPDRGFFPVLRFELKNRLDFKNIDQEIEIHPPVALRYLKVMTGPGTGGPSSMHSEWKAFGKMLSDAELQEQLAKQTEKERNLLAREAGGRMIAATDSSFEYAIDGHGVLFGEEASLDSGYEAVFAFQDGKTAYITKMAVPIIESSETNCRTFEVSASEDSPSAGFGEPQAFQTTNMVFPGNIFQEFTLKPVLKAKYLKVRLVDTHGEGGYCYLPELHAIGTFTPPAAPLSSPQSEQPQDHEQALSP